MTRDNNETRKKANAVFFSVIMVISMVAIGFAGFAGTAAAANTAEGDITFDDQAIDANDEVEAVVDDLEGGSATDAVVVVTYEDGGDTIFAGSTEQTVNNGDTVNVEVEDTDGFPGEHTAHLFNQSAAGGLGLTPGDTVDSSTAALALDADDGFVTTNTITYIPGTPFQGQDVTAHNESFLTNEEGYELRRVTAEDGGSVDGSTFIEEVEVEDNVIEIDTSDLDADDYFLRGPELPRNPSMDETFEVRAMSLDADFDDDTVADAGGDALTDLDIESNRNRYTLNVSADGDLDNEELFEILTDGEDPDAANTYTAQQVDDGVPTRGGEEGPFNVFLYDEDEEDADEKVGMFDISDTEDTANFTDIDDGDYEFLFESFETDAEDTAEITVEDVDDAELEFVESTVDTTQGGVVGITVEANEAADSGLLVIGEEDDFGYQLNVTIDEFNEETDQITVYFNTYAAGTSDGGDIEDNILWVDEDDLDEDAEIDWSATEEHEDTDNLQFILSEGDYDMSVLAQDDDFDEAVENPDDVGSLLLEERETNDLNVWTASDDTVDDIDDIDDILAGAGAGNVTERDLVAQDDWAIHELDATGLEGMFQYAVRNDYGLEGIANLTGDDAGLLTDKNNEDNARAARVRLRETRDSAGPNTNRRLVNFSNVSAEIILQDDLDGVFIAVDTGDLQDDDAFTPDSNHNALDDEEDYEFNMNFRLEDEWLLDWDAEDDDDLDELYQSVDSTYDVDERTGEFLEDPTNVTAEEDIEITADTNIAPGSEVNMRARSSGDTRPSFIKTQSDLEVTQDEDVTGTFDFSDTNVGDAFDLSIRGGDYPDRPEADGNVVDAVETDTPTPEPEPEPEPTPEPEPEPTPEPEPEPTPEPEPEDTPEPTDDDTPGFGAVVALIALIAAALLATRRRP